MKNKGISLITLVITIIIMIILAGAIILTLSQSGIFDKANEATDKYNSKQQQILDDLIWAENYPNGGQGGTSNVPTKWRENVVAIVDEVPIPKGFVSSPYDGSDGMPAENAKAGGMVIYALTPDEIKDGVTALPKDESHQTSMETRNQFVWIPVDDFVNDFKRYEFLEVTSKISNTLGSGYWELALDESTNMPSSTQDEAYVTATTLAEAIAMYASIAKYGGFYIARYEAGKDDKDNISITMGKYPYYVAWGNGLLEQTNDVGAVSLSRTFYPKDNGNYGVVSTLTYGVQWDTTLNWWKKQDELDGSIDLNLKSSRNQGNYCNTVILLEEYNENAKYAEYDMENNEYGSWSNAVAKEAPDTLYGCRDWLLTSGAFKKANIYNIYDMAGNLLEWTMEGCYGTFRTSRGGSLTGYGNWNSGMPVSHRNMFYPDTENKAFGFRPSLYIK